MLVRRYGSIVAVCAVSLALSAAVFAQNPPAPGGRGQRGQRGGARVQLVQVPVAVLESALKLTADQKSKISGIQDKYEADAKPFRPARGTPPDPANQQKLRELTTQASKDIQAVLTPEQTEKLKTLAPLWSTLRSSGVPLALIAQLKLTDDQKDKIAAIAKDTAEKLRAMTPAERTTQRRALMQDARTKIEALLTADQKAVIEKYNQDHPRGRGRRNQ